MIDSAGLLSFLITSVFSFLVGLEVKSYHQKFHPDDKKVIGTTRTYTFLGIVGFLFYHIDPRFLVFTAGFAGFTILYAIFYYQRAAQQRFSILGYLVGCIVYSIGPLTILSPFWLAALVLVLVIFILNARREINNLTRIFSGAELETLGKMILLSAVILPLLPDKNVIPYLPLSPFKIWLAVVVISAISYAGYIAQTYLFPSKGIFLTGIIGGAYSSTATTVVLAKKAQNTPDTTMSTAAIIAATAVMYFRLIVVAAVFNLAVAKIIAPPLFFFTVVTFLIAVVYYRRGSHEKNRVDMSDANPLELGTAFVFAALFVVMIFVTQFVTHQYGSAGLKLLSFVVGFTDIDPFILSLLTGKYSVTHQDIYAAVLIAAGSNNILKALYALWFGGRKKTMHVSAWLGLLGGLTIGAGLLAEIFA